MCGACAAGGLFVPRGGGNLRDRSYAGLIGPEQGKTKRGEARRGDVEEGPQQPISHTVGERNKNKENKIFFLVCKLVKKRHNKVTPQLAF
jgi:hypothetical protein